MNNRKSIFSTRLMLEGFRQCKLVGILALVIMVLGAILVPVGIAISYSDAQDFVPEAVEFISINVFLVLVIPAGAIMTMVLFHFLDTRSASDLYHALPHKRITLYLSYTASIILWVLILALANTICSVVTCLIVSKYLVLVMSSVIPEFVSVLLITALVVGGISIAINLTGTVFTNIVLSGMILFLPRVCFVIIRMVIFDNIPFITGSAASGGIFGNDTNLLFGFCSMIMELGVSSDSIFHPAWRSIIYTLVLAIVYLAIAAVLFCYRRSEAAGQSAPTRMHQHVYRIVLTFAYSIVITSILMTCVVNIDAEEIFMFGVFYLIGILINFVYEIITTKKWRNLISTLPGLALIAGLNLGLAVGLTGVEKYIVENRPKADEINSVSIGSFDEWYDSSRYYDYAGYVSVKNMDIEITDPEVISLFSYYLDENVTTWKSGEYAYYNKYRYSAADKYEPYSVKIDSKNGELTRIIYVAEEDSDKIMSIIENIPEYAENWRNPPKPIKDTLSVTGIMSSSDFSDEEIKNLFDIYCQELKDMPFNDLIEGLSGYDAQMEFLYSFNENGVIRQIGCPVTHHMEKTISEYYNLLYKLQAKDRNEFGNMINSGEYYMMDFNFQGQGENGEEIYMYNSCSEPEEIKDVYSHLSKYIIDTPIENDGLYAVIWLYPVDYNNNTVNFTINLDKQILKDEYFRQYTNSEGRYGYYQ